MEKLAALVPVTGKPDWWKRWKGGTRFFSSLASNFQPCQQFPALPAISTIAAAPGKFSCLLGALGASVVRYDLVMPARPAVFLDRDGTLTPERGYLTRPEQVRLLPGAAEAIRLLRE